MRVKLLVPPAIHPRGPEARRILLPHGISILTSFLRQNGIFVDIQDLDAELRSPHSHLKQRKILPKLSKYGCLQLKTGCYTGITDKRNDLLATSLLDLASVQSYDLIGFGVNSELQILTVLLLAEKIKKHTIYRLLSGGRM